MYKDYYSPPLWGEKFIKSVGGRVSSFQGGNWEYHGCGEEYNVDRRERGSNINFPIILRLFERISSGEGAEFLRKKIKI